jgi:apolipoprotein N-acyltransferase
MTPVGAAQFSPAGKDDAGGVDVVAYAPAWRWVAAALKVVARGSLLYTAGLFLFSDTPPNNPLRQLRLFAGFFLAPEVTAWCIARAFAARLFVRDGALVLEQSQRTTEIPVTAIVGIEPWLIPLPRAGFGLRLRSGRRFGHEFALANSVAVVDALVAEGASPDLCDGLDRRVVHYNSARVAYPAGWLEHPLVKFVLYSLIPTVPAFRLHQFITYGGAFGEYYTFGLQAYLVGFGLWWASWCLGLVILAAVIRAFVELLVIAATAVVPSYATGVRRVLEVLQRVVYYVGIPTWLVLRFTA